jgi:hypothetical protein
LYSVNEDFTQFTIIKGNFTEIEIIDLFCLDRSEFDRIYKSNNNWIITSENKNFNQKFEETLSKINSIEKVRKKRFFKILEQN